MLKNFSGIEGEIISPVRNLVLVGAGPHAKKRYLPLIERYRHEYEISIPLVVDFTDREESVLSDVMIGNSKFLFLDPKTNRTSEKLNPLVRKELDTLWQAGRIDGMIISTEPKGHKMYAEWALHHDVDILMDKPVTSPINCGNDERQAKKIYQDYLDLKKEYFKSKSNFIIPCLRRYSNTYRFIHSYLTDLVKKYQIPISFMDIYHADGTWCMPGEFYSKENHPYKYGYGMLMHTGYHLVDLLAWFSQINDEIEGKKPDKVRLYVSSVSPYDFLGMIDTKGYEKIFGVDRYNDLMMKNNFELKKFGELDVCVNFQFLRKDKVITTAIMNLLQNSYSQRSQADLQPDIYINRGRVKHERFNIQVSHLLNLQAYSYQPEIKKKLGKKSSYSIDIYSNPHLASEKEVVRIDSEKLLAKKMKDGGYDYFDYEKTLDESFVDFLEKRKSKSDLLFHERTNLLLSKIYEAIGKGRRGKIPYVEFDL